MRAMRFPLGLFVIIFTSIALFFSAANVMAANESHEQRVDRVNGGTVGIISGGIGGTYIRIATDLSAVLDDGNDLRILPIMGKGSVQNITDILYLRGIDVGIVQSDVLAFIKAQGLHYNIDKRIHYITKLYNEEFHLIAGSDITSIGDLAGKKVNFGVSGSGTFMTASTVFSTAGVEVEPTNFDQALALSKLKNGEIDAMVYVAGKPTKVLTEIKPEDGLHLVDVPYKAGLRETYLPSSFTDKDYPGLVAKGGKVETVAVGAVMAVFNWSKGNARYQKVEKFIDAFFSKFPEFLKEPRHQKWGEVNLAATLPGWTRFRPAAEWLEKRAKTAQNEEPKMMAAFTQFLDKATGNVQLTEEQKQQLFQQFMSWQQNGKVQ